ncbi:4'-phosphopantetheinyl transferase [Pasteurellaceae bacterium 15-036681]|nr:4'-phosphopantetheinyl transferase [Pasteurellaceae bacterium 15-036681]
MPTLPIVEILFAHNDEPLPEQFHHYAKPENKTIDELSTRQLSKWKSRRMAHFLLHQLFERHNLDTTLLNQIHKTASGRPYVDHPQIDFNISHSGDWVAIILTVCQPKIATGIDIEHPQKTRRYLDLLNYYADEQEIKELASHSVLSTLPHRFYLSWCLREAVLKSQGVGIVKLSEVAHSPSRLLIKTAYAPKGKLYFYHQLPFYLAYFIEQPESGLLAPTLQQWKNNNYQTSGQFSPIIYQVN